MLADVRRYFDDRGILEVSTPVLGASGVSDLHLENLKVELTHSTAYLQTSPEYAMKRLLAAGSGPIYQICPAFRGGESGRRHHPEFTMLEWYRPGFSLADLIDEVDCLLRCLHSDLPPLTQATYAELFEQVTDVNPHQADVRQLQELAGRFGLDASHIEHHDDSGCLGDYLDLLFATLVEPDLEYVAVLDFPACQAALARCKTLRGAVLVANRFEIYVGGMELANGYEELRDPEILRQRFDGNNRMRSSRGLEAIEPDERLLAALPNMPACCGVAVGFDRLMMIVHEIDDIGQIIPFAADFRLPGSAPS